jgi:hypothetical protein
MVLHTAAFLILDIVIAMQTWVLRISQNLLSSTALVIEFPSWIIELRGP